MVKMSVMSMVVMSERKLIALKHRKNGVASDMPKEELLVDGATENDLAMLDAPSIKELD